jgi:hypothetical protein
MAHPSRSLNIPAEPVFPLSIPVEALQPMVEEILRSVDRFPGWPLGKVALQEDEAAVCIGVKPHVLRDARLQRKLPHSRVGRTVTYTADQLRTALELLSVNG